MSVINAQDVFNPDTPEATLDYVKNQTARSGSKLQCVVVVYEDENHDIRIAASKAGMTQHLGMLEVGKNIIHRFNEDR